MVAASDKQDQQRKRAPFRINRVPPGRGKTIFHKNVPLQTPMHTPLGFEYEDQSSFTFTPRVVFNHPLSAAWKTLTMSHNTYTLQPTEVITLFYTTSYSSWQRHLNESFVYSHGGVLTAALAAASQLSALNRTRKDEISIGYLIGNQYPKHLPKSCGKFFVFFSLALSRPLY